MPPAHLRIDLRRGNSDFDPLAAFKVLAIMCYPNAIDVPKREAMLATVQKGTGEGRARREGLHGTEFDKHVKLCSGRAAVAGGVLLTRMQLYGNGFSSSQNTAIRLVHALLPKWKNSLGPSWSRNLHVGHRPHSKKGMLKAIHDFESVAHLWAALLHGVQHSRTDIWPGAIGSLPVFLSYAEGFRDLACHIPTPQSSDRYLISRSRTWHFIIPAGSRHRAQLRALPFDASMLALLNERT